MAVSGIHEHTLSNGLKVVAEPIAHAQSVAMTMLVPAGVVAEPEDQQGAAALLSEMIYRGAGDLDAKAHSDALDRLGVQRGSEVETYHLQLGATMIGTKLSQAMPLLMDMVRRPTLTEGVLEPSRDLAIQSLDALEDEPQQKIFLELKGRHFPQPLGRSPLGRRADLEAIRQEQIKDYHRQTFVPGGSVLGFAGQFDWSELQSLVEDLLGNWQGAEPVPQQQDAAPRGYHHKSADTTQVQIGLMYDTLPEPDERSMLWRAAAAVLSGGMSGRLFTEVREKRGLCYAVYAAYVGQRDQGVIVSYAGTTAPRAQETLDVLCGEHVRLGEGIDEDEFTRAIVGMKSRLVMQGESTGARARAIATDQYIYGRPRSLDEVSAKVDAVTIDDLRSFLAEHRADAMTIVTIGPDALRVA